MNPNRYNSMEHCKKDEFYEVSEQEADFKEGIMKQRADHDDETWWQELNEEDELDFDKEEE